MNRHSGTKAKRSGKPAPRPARTPKTSHRGPRGNTQTSAPLALPPPGTPLIVSRDLLGHLLGVHPDTISDYTRGGMPVLEPGEGGRAGKYDAIACSAWWRVRRPGTLEADKSRRERSQADLNELRLAERRSQLVAREQVIHEGQSVMLAFRARVIALARLLVQRGLVTLDHQSETKALCLEMLADMSRWRAADMAALAKADDKEHVDG